MKSARQRRLAPSEAASRLSGNPPRSQSLVGSLATDLSGVERCQLQIANASCQRLARLLEQIDRRRAQHEESAGAPAAPPSRVDEPAQALEELRRALDLVEDDELVLVLRQVELGLGELGAVGLGLEIEIDRRPGCGHLQRQRCLAHLARPQQRHGRGLGQGTGERGEQVTGNHHCNYGETFRNCKVMPKWRLGVVPTRRPEMKANWLTRAPPVQPPVPRRTGDS